jgi:hypothetical protein
MLSENTHTYLIQTPSPPVENADNVSPGFSYPCFSVWCLANSSGVNLPALT